MRLSMGSAICRVNLGTGRLMVDDRLDEGWLLRRFGHS